MLHQTILILGQNSVAVKNRVGETVKKLGLKNLASPDTLVLGESAKSIGIDEIREARKFLSQKPLSEPKRLLLIYNAEKLTTESQNALLKIMEEPPSKAQILLVAKGEGDLLPTVTSRCQRLLVSAAIEPDPKILALAQKFLASGVGERLNLIEEHRTQLTNREDACEFLEAVLYCLKGNLNKGSESKAAQVLRLRREIFSTNVSPRLGLEALSFD